MPFKFANLDGTCGKWVSQSSLRPWPGNAFRLANKDRDFPQLEGTYKPILKFANFTRIGTFFDGGIREVNFSSTYGITRTDWNVQTTTGVLPAAVMPTSGSIPVAIRSQMLDKPGAWVLKGDTTGTWSIQSFTDSATYTITIRFSPPGSTVPWAFVETYFNEVTFDTVKARILADLQDLKNGVEIPRTGAGGEGSWTTQQDRYLVGGASLGFTEFDRGSSGQMVRSTIWQCGNHSLKSVRQQQQGNSLIAITTCENFMICGGSNCTSFKKEVEPPDMTELEARGFQFTFGTQFVVTKRKDYYANQSCP